MPQQSRRPQQNRQAGPLPLPGPMRRPATGAPSNQERQRQLGLGAGQATEARHAAPPADAPAAIGSNPSLGAETVRTGLGSSPKALRALDALTGDEAWTRLSTAQQGALLEQFQRAPNAATVQHLLGQAAYHTARPDADPDERLAAWRDARDPDGGTLQSGDTTYTVVDGVLQDARGQAVGRVRTDGTWKLDTEQEWHSVYDDIHARVQLTEGSGRDRETLLNLHDADPNARLAHDNVNDSFAQDVTDAVKTMRREDLDMRVVQGYRSFAEQDQLYAQGRTRPGSRVTNARGGQSWHNYGVAADLTFPDANGGIDWATTGGDHPAQWERYGEVARDKGLEWGGDWQTLTDLPHVETHPGMAATGDALREYRRNGLEGVWDELGLGGDRPS